ncbi:MAG: hypothetical protein LUH51_01495, partial [Firmicutes bacterium]|nr:hypothetical protein [Bacillota bacterium]
VRAWMENADPEAAGTGGRPVLLTLVGLRPPSVSKTAALMNKLFPFFRSHIIDKWTPLPRAANASCNLRRYAV